MGNDSDRVFEMSDGHLREMSAKERKKHSLMESETGGGGGGGGGEKEEFVPPKGEEDMDEDESSISPSSSSVYLRYFLSPGAASSIPLILLFLASLVTLQSAAVGSDLWLSYWYERNHFGAQKSIFKFAPFFFFRTNQQEELRALGALAVPSNSIEEACADNIIPLHVFVVVAAAAFLFIYFPEQPLFCIVTTRCSKYIVFLVFLFFFPSRLSPPSPPSFPPSSTPPSPPTSPSTPSSSF